MFAGRSDSGTDVEFVAGEVVLSGCRLPRLQIGDGLQRGSDGVGVLSGGAKFVAVFVSHRFALGIEVLAGADEIHGVGGTGIRTNGDCERLRVSFNFLQLTPDDE